MKMADFKALSIEERITKLNKHLLSIKDLPGRLEDNFKNNEFEFSYSLLKKNAKNLGIAVDGKHYTAFRLDGFSQQNVINQTSEENVVKVQQDIVNVEKVVKQQQNNVKQDVVNAQQTLTNDEIAFIKDLYAKSQLNNEQQFIVNGKPMLVVPTMVGAKKTTGISVYSEQWERWAQFKSKYNMYSGTDLLAMALQEFMDKYSDE